MELKNKCLKDFWIWYLLPEQRKTYKTNSLLGKAPAIKLRFLAMSFTERYGVYVDWFDSVGIEIFIYDYIRTPILNYEGFVVKINGNVIGEYSTRHEARTEAINKAQDIFNGL